MSGSTVNSKDNILSVLSDEMFWPDAFDQEAPFYDSYIKYFKKGIINEITNVLDTHWEAIYYLKDHALGPVITRLIQLAAKYPDSSFIENLSFFLSRDIQQDRLISAFFGIELNIIESLITDIECLSSYLVGIGDENIAEELLKFQSLLIKIKTNKA